MKAFWTGSYTDTGKLDLVIMPSTSGNLLNVDWLQMHHKRVTPFAHMVKIGMNTYLTDPIAIPCGHCVGCRMDKAKQWKIRNCHEAELYDYDELHFITLTYDRGFIPNVDGVPSLRPQDMSDFMRRLRNPSYGVKKQYRFFSCGEYGEKQKRPHMHLILYGKLDDCVPYAWQCATSETIAKAWPYGIHQVKPVEENMIAYVCGYVEKKQNDPLWFSYPVKPFLKMSTRPGIGSYYAAKIDGHDRHVYGKFHKHVAGIPRAYLKPHEQDEWFKLFKEQSIEIARQTLINNLGAAHTTDEEILGDICEAALLESLEKLRSPSL